MYDPRPSFAHPQVQDQGDGSGDDTRTIDMEMYGYCFEPVSSARVTQVPWTPPVPEDE